MTDFDTRTLVDQWLAMWNGELEIAQRIIAPSVRVHLPAFGMPDEEGIDTPDRLAAWIGLFRSSFSSAHFSCELGPFTDGDHVISRFRFTGVWDGGRPDMATAPPGTAVSFAGVDTLRIERGRIAEYWLTDDQLDLYAQLGAVRDLAPQSVGCPRDVR
ncbi:hypothetical protein GT034_28930 [Streptomyces sp. SID2563]|uniref:ester cyclase n=1 Tax=Streptomyces sp. SID2563 TaxID=2690255 RepID=UPI00136ACC9C|nr:ester cyclase [Streptomyces sp. SID2563]MYW12338.1 hypothetical protein [Streptomyces sp. SID2563]